MMISELPLDLESEILSRVPAKSLTQFRFTCKRWYALFKDPGFIKKNLGKAETQVIIKNDRNVYSGTIHLHRFHNGFDPSFELTGKLSLKDSEHVEIDEIFHCDGLLLCTTKDRRLVVCNPCTGQTRWIQPIQPISSSSMCKRLNTTYVLGYENITGSYRIVRFGLYSINDQTVPEVGIYEFNSDSWRVLDVFTSFACDEWINLPRAVSLMGNTYWEHYLVDYILMFDFTTERLRRLSAPYQSDNDDDDDDDDRTAVLSVVKQEKLALLRFDMKSSEMRIWVTNTKIDTAKDLSWSSWSDFLVVEIHECLTSMGFLVDEENKMAVYCDTDMCDEGDDESIRIYIVGEKMHKEVYQETGKGTSLDDLPFILSYVPSLVHIPQATRGKRKR